MNVGNNNVRFPLPRGQRPREIDKPVLSRLVLSRLSPTSLKDCLIQADTAEKSGNAD